ncbi:MAG: prepilin-type N-terminal cleavage/methylation domain-containing protein [Patescibacteria group bacterium]
MCKSFTKNKQGFTLIESIIYLALFTIVLGGGMAATYQVIEATNAASNHIILQAEANFLFRKIDWAFTGAESIALPNTYTLNIVKNTPLTITATEGDLTLQRASNAPVVLNSSRVAVNSFSVEVNESFRKPAVKTNFILTTAQNGKLSSQTFSTTKYLELGE